MEIKSPGYLSFGPVEAENIPGPLTSSVGDGHKQLLRRVYELIIIELRFKQFRECLAHVKRWHMVYFMDIITVYIANY